MARWETSKDCHQVRECGQNLKEVRRTERVHGKVPQTRGRRRHKAVLGKRVQLTVALCRGNFNTHHFLPFRIITMHLLFQLQQFCISAKNKAKLKEIYKLLEANSTLQKTARDALQSSSIKWKS